MQQRRNRNYGRRNTNGSTNSNGNNGNRNNNNRSGGQKRFNAKQAENKRDNYLNSYKEHLRNDRVKAEQFLQHAEHYQRLINEHASEYKSRRDNQSDGEESDDEEDSDDNAEYSTSDKSNREEPEVTEFEFEKHGAFIDESKKAALAKKKPAPRPRKPQRNDADENKEPELALPPAIVVEEKPKRRTRRKVATEAPA